MLTAHDAGLVAVSFTYIVTMEEDSIAVESLLKNASVAWAFD